MERVETLLQKLQSQFKEGYSADQLLVTVQMLQHELVHIKGSQPANEQKAIVVSMPIQQIPVAQAPVVEKPVRSQPEERTVEVLKIDEDEIAAELEEIKRNATARQHMGSYSKPQLLFEEPEHEVPTLAQHDLSKSREVNEAVSSTPASLNERLKELKIEISEKLTEQPVKDLKKAIGINDRFLYINDLFRGDDAMYERSIKTINSFSIWAEAEYWIRRELKIKLGWTDDNETVKQFDQLIRRRFA